MSKAFTRLALEMQKNVDEIRGILDKILVHPDSILADKNNNNNLKIEKKLYEIYDNLVEYKDVFSKNNNLSFSDKIAPSGHIKIDVAGEEIHIKMGRLPRKSQGKNMVVDDLNQTLFSLLKEGKTLPKLPKKIIEITHIYPADCVAETIKDNDNYNYKAIINTLCHFTSGTDRGDNCWLIFKTKIAEDYSVGTEIRVYPQEEKTVV